MKAIDRPFTKIINGTTQFVIPVFQRDYSWTEANCDQLWKDVVTIASDPTNRGHEIEDPTGMAEDASQWKFFVNATYEGGVDLSVQSEADIDKAIPMIRQARGVARA